MKGLINKAKWLLIGSGVLSIVAGIVLLFYPLGVTLAATKIIGAVLLIAAVIDGVYFIMNFKKFYAGWLMVRALVSACIGLLFLTQTALSTGYMFVIFGLWIMFSGSVHFANSFVVRNLGMKQWYWAMLGGILEVIAGLLIIFEPLSGMLATALIIAITLIVDGVMSLIDALRVQKAMNSVKRWQKAVAQLVTPEE
ncbi:DUF308 domain-containing protein [bacterium]|nr:DUF308 domain-containing protein [bacterium]MBQ6436623.1 DUF308 domain-containing protein [bacterium]